MKTIKITLNETGSTACIVKTFSVYQNSYKEQEFEVRVPKSFFIESNGNEFVTVVKMGAILYGESGKTVETKSYFMDKIGEDTRFYIYKALLPKSFVLYKGVQDLVFNVVNIDTNEGEVLSIVTTQKAPLEVVASAYIEDEEIEPTDAEILYGLVAEKQNKDTTGDEHEISIAGITESKEVVEAINKTGEKVLQNIEEIGANAEDISQNASKIAGLEAVVGTGQEYIGTLRGSVLPSDIGLNDFVVSQKSRQAKGGDLVLFILEIEGATDKTYRYNFNGTEWSGYEIPPVELAGNGSAGLVAGTYGVGSENTTIVDIIGGEIKNIYVKDGSGDYRNVREYLNTDKARIDNILSGASSVGKALRAVSDELGNNIVDTYLTINAGASKRYVRDYALPRTFNDSYYLAAEGYVLEVPEATVPQFSVISDQIGDTELFEATLEVGAEYELSRKNSSSNSVSILADSNVTARLRLSTFIDDTPLSVELSNAVEFKTGEMVRVEFGSDFTLLGDNVLNVIDGDKIKQVLEVVRDTSAEVTFEVWSNETYPSIFGLNTQTQRIVVAQGELGEQEVIEAEGTVAENSVVFSLNNFDLNTNTEIFFDLKVATVEEIGEAVEVKFELDGETVRIATPYNFESGQATVGMLKQVFTAFGGGFQKWAFKGFVREIGSDLVCFADLDDFGGILNGVEMIFDPAKTYLKVKISVDNNEFTLLTGNSGSPNYTIEWGDGSSDNIADTSNPTHTYEKAGMYLITISGSFTNGIEIEDDENPNKDKIIEVYGGSNYPTSIGNYAFYDFRNLTTANFSSVTNIGVDAFRDCASLTTASFPKVTSIVDGAFRDCASLTTTSFPNATSIGSNAFNGCTSLTTANFPNATSIGNYAFRDCTSLKELTLGNIATTATGTRFQNVKLINLKIAQDVTETDIERILQLYSDNGGTFTGNETKHGLQVEKTPTADNDVVNKIYLDTNIVNSLNNKVDKVADKALSTNDLTNTLKSNYDAAYSHSQIVDSSNPHATTFANLESKPTTISGYGITDAYTKTEVDSKLTAVYKYKGSVANFASLPTSGLTIGDVYNVEDTGDNYAWTGTVWDKLAGTIDLSGYVPTSRTINGHALSSDVTVSKSDVGLGNAYNPTTYGGISYGGGAGEAGISFTDLNSLVYTGSYTCFGTTANVPSASYSWFIQHINSNVGNVSATQTAIAYGTTNIIYKRNKSNSTWSAWENISPSLKENLTNKVTSISSSSTDTQYPSAKCVYDIIGDIESLLAEV